MADSLAANPHYVIGCCRALVEMSTGPKRDLYRMTLERAVERLAEVLAEFDAAQPKGGR